MGALDLLTIHCDVPVVPKCSYFYLLAVYFILFELNSVDRRLSVMEQVIRYNAMEILIFFKIICHLLFLIVFL